MPLLQVSEIIGILTFALSGLFISYKERLDILGLFIIVFLTALGGGVVRDVIVGRIPYSFTHYAPTLLILTVMIVGILLKLHRNRSIERTLWYILSDTLGLVSFAISGALIALEAGLNIVGVALLALTTAIGGGAMRDILLNRIPFFLKTEFYGSVALIIGLFIYLLDHFEMLNRLSISLIFLGGISLRLAAYYRGWHLPKI